MYHFTTKPVLFDTIGGPISQGIGSVKKALQERI